MNNDLTVILLTNNELPEEWAKFQYETLLKDINGAELITVSRIPMPWINIIQTEKKCPSNIYWQMLKAAKLSTRKYIAIAEDDTLYNEEHFKLRPKEWEFGYNMTHWSLFTWWEPTYHWRNRQWNYSMIAHRELLIEALEERFAMWPDGIPDNRVWELGKHIAERNMRVTLRRWVDMWTTIPIINFHHEFATDVLQVNQRKRMGMIRCYDVPHWWKASEIVCKFR